MTTHGPTLVFIHGLGATPGGWRDAIDAVMTVSETSSAAVTVTLPGHGTAEWTGGYTLPDLAQAVVAELQAQPDGAASADLVIVGHSLGGAVGIELASGRYDCEVRAVLGLGIKTTWTDDDVAGMAKVAARGVRWFRTRDEAEARFLRLAGLDGLVDPDHQALHGAVVEGTGPEAGSWRVAQDPMTFAQQPVDMPALLAAARCPVWLGAGEHDAMATEAELLAFTDAPRIASGRGHNVHVEDPGWVASLVAELIARAG